MTPAGRPPRGRLPRPSADQAAPAPSPGDAASSQLAERIRAEISSAPDRRITFARFMERALYEPELGYYRRAPDRPTDAGDFLTAPETHPIFGWTIARRIEELWGELGRPRRFALVEYGAGSGTLALSVLDGMRRHGATELLETIRYEPIESNPHRRDDLRRRFVAGGFAGLLGGSEPNDGAGPAASDASVPVSGVLLANEFLDALPVHRVVVRGGKLLELFVTWRDAFVEAVAEPSTPALAERFALDGIDVAGLAEGQVAEICLGLEPWLDDAAGRLARGFAIAIDYGFDATELYGGRRLAGTLLGYRDHRVVENALEQPGGTDLTAHVDFTAVHRLAERRGFRTVSSTTQSEFLVGAGLESELQALQASPELTIADYTRARSGILRMLDPRHMGKFRVLTLSRG